MSKANLTRLDGSLNYNENDEVIGIKQANIGYEGIEVVQNDFDTCYPWNKIEEITDANGNQWVRIPLFYTWYEMEDGAIKGRKISEYQIDENWFANPIFRRGEDLLSYVDISKYLISSVGGLAWTKTGDTPLKIKDLVM